MSDIKGALHKTSLEPEVRKAAPVIDAGLVLKCLTEAAFLVDAQGMLVSFNAAAEQLFAESLHERIGHPWISQGLHTLEHTEVSTPDQFLLHQTLQSQISKDAEFYTGEQRVKSGQAEPRLAMPLTQEAIAGMTGTSRETVSRVLHQFQRDKLISIKGAFLTVLQPKALEQLAI